VSAKAIVAIARKLLVAVWHVLTERAADKHADPQRVATKLMRWSWGLTDKQRGGLTSRQFTRSGYHGSAQHVYQSIERNSRLRDQHLSMFLHQG
jgi:hypothetical protein